MQPEAFKWVSEQLDALAQDEQIDKLVRDFVDDLRGLIAKDQNTHTTFKALDEKIREFNKQRKEEQAEAPASPTEPTSADPA